MSSKRWSLRRTGPDIEAFVESFLFGGSRDEVEKAVRDVVRSDVIRCALERLEFWLDDRVENRPWEKLWTGTNFATRQMFERAIVELRAEIGDLDEKARAASRSAFWARLGVRRRRERDEEDARAFFAARRAIRIAAGLEVVVGGRLP